MKIKTVFLLILLSSTLFISMCSGKEKRTQIIIKTKFGSVTVELYNETPKHRDNFIKLIKDSVYTDLLFHRTIKEFMIQGGDLDSKNAKPGALLGEGGLPYTIPAEFKPDLYHKRGVIAAARESDQVNPLRLSSSTQFYIVQGKKFTMDELNRIEQKKNLTTLSNKLKELRRDQINANALKTEASEDSLYAIAKKYAEENLFHFSSKQKETYREIGGTPQLDGSYTVFGEVIQGMEVVDKIANLPTDSNDRPLEDIRFSITIKEK